jgi:hypothetical protein
MDDDADLGRLEDEPEQCAQPGCTRPAVRELKGLPLCAEHTPATVDAADLVDELGELDLVDEDDVAW